MRGLFETAKGYLGLHEAMLWDPGRDTGADVALASEAGQGRGVADDHCDEGETHHEVSYSQSFPFTVYIGLVERSSPQVELIQQHRAGV